MLMKGGFIMKKIFILIVMMLLASSFVFAQGAQTQAGVDDVEETEDVDDVDEEMEEKTEDEREEDPEKQLERVRERLKEYNGAENVQELKEIVRLKGEELNMSIGQVKQQFTELHQNQNQVRLAVHALLSMEGLVGGIGKNVSAIARDFNNSVQKTVLAEEKIQTRGWITRLFAGGDAEAAEELETELEQHRERVQELRRLQEGCTEECSEEVRAIMEEQIQQLEQERERLQELAQEEKAKKGLFGWIWK